MRSATRRRRHGPPLAGGTQGGSQERREHPRFVVTSLAAPHPRCGTKTSMAPAGMVQMLASGAGCSAE